MIGDAAAVTMVAASLAGSRSQAAGAASEPGTTTLAVSTATAMPSLTPTGLAAADASSAAPSGDEIGAASNGDRARLGLLARSAAEEYRELPAAAAAAAALPSAVPAADDGDNTNSKELKLACTFSTSA